MKTLIFGTTYVSTPERACVLQLWFDAAMRNDCDLMIVDSASPLMPYVPRKVQYYSFPDNVGHLSHGGRDGWGRAFCHGLDAAVLGGYDYVAHVEGDSVLLPPVREVFEHMRGAGAQVMSTQVSSMKSWIETGLMLFSVDWLRKSSFTTRYDWTNRCKYPEPERVVGSLVCTYDQLPWRAMRDDFRELTLHNVGERKLDWLTHAPLAVMEEFARAPATV